MKNWEKLKTEKFFDTSHKIVNSQSLCVRVGRDRYNFLFILDVIGRFLYHCKVNAKNSSPTLGQKCLHLFLCYRREGIIIEKLYPKPSAMSLFVSIFLGLIYHFNKPSTSTINTIRTSMSRISHSHLGQSLL